MWKLEQMQRHKDEIGSESSAFEILFSPNLTPCDSRNWNVQIVPTLNIVPKIIFSPSPSMTLDERNPVMLIENVKKNKGKHFTTEEINGYKPV